MNLLVDYRSIHLQPGSKLSHILIVKGRIIEGYSIGSLGIHFTAPGHQEIGLNSTPIVVTVRREESCNS